MISILFLLFKFCAIHAEPMGEQEVIETKLFTEFSSKPQADIDNLTSLTFSPELGDQLKNNSLIEDRMVDCTYICTANTKARDIIRHFESWDEFDICKNAILKFIEPITLDFQGSRIFYNHFEELTLDGREVANTLSFGEEKEHFKDFQIESVGKIILNDLYLASFRKIEVYDITFRRINHFKFPFLDSDDIRVQNSIFDGNFQNIAPEAKEMTSENAPLVENENRRREKFWKRKWNNNNKPIQEVEGAIIASNHVNVVNSVFRKNQGVVNSPRIEFTKVLVESNYILNELSTQNSLLYATERIDLKESVFRKNYIRISGHEREAGNIGRMDSDNERKTRKENGRHVLDRKISNPSIINGLEAEVIVLTDFSFEDNWGTIIKEGSEHLKSTMICGDIVATKSNFIDNRMHIFQGSATKKTGGSAVYGYFEGKEILFQGNSVNFYETNNCHEESYISEKEEKKITEEKEPRYVPISCVPKALMNITTSKGGALYITEYKTGEDSLPVHLNYLTCTSCTFSSNKADNGGAIYMAKGTRGDIFDGTFVNNVANDKGGAIYLEENTSFFVFDHTRFIRNSALEMTTQAAFDDKEEDADKNKNEFSSSTVFVSEKSTTNVCRLETTFHTNCATREEDIIEQLKAWNEDLCTDVTIFLNVPKTYDFDGVYLNLENMDDILLDASGIEEGSVSLHRLYLTMMGEKLIEDMNFYRMPNPDIYMDYISTTLIKIGECTYENPMELRLLPLNATDSYKFELRRLCSVLEPNLYAFQVPT